MLISKRAEDLFLQAHGLDPETRAQFITEACGDDRELLDEVRSLLAAANESEAYFDGLSGRIGLPALAEDEPPPRENRILGAWRLLKLIGRGGMGSVYLAERADGQFEQRAALKVLPMGVDGAEARARFLAERQILAGLVHDNIARLLDGGVTEEGLPFFVMDYVAGIPIDEYCAQHRLDVGDRLRLVLAICDAVQYAHRNLIVHRDLKPGNVLVEDSGRVRLLDFGIAKVLEPSAEERHVTRIAQRPATPAFASPEMLRGEAVDVTTDVYSIGVLMYLLLTQRLPITYDGLSLPEMHERAATAIPPAPSRFDGGISRDLDAVIGKALARRPEERYPSVESLAGDIRNCLAGLPVGARPPSVWYRAGKFVARHRFGVAFAAFGVLALVSITGIAVNSAIKSERQTQAIALERDRAEQIKDFLVGIFDSANPNRAAADLTARELLESGRRRIATDLAGRPEVQAELLKTMGDVYGAIRLPEEMREVLESERRLRLELTGAGSMEYARVLIALSQVEDMAGNLDLSQKHAEDALAISRRNDDILGIAEARKRIARIQHLKGNYEQAEAGYREALDTFSAELGDEAPDADKVRLHLATLLNHTERSDEALPLLEQVLRTREELYPGDHSEFAEVFLTMGTSLKNLERYDDAASIYERGRAMTERLFGPDNRYSLFFVNGLGVVAENSGDYANAATLFRRAMELTAAQFPDHPNLGIATANLGKALMRDGRCDLALPHLRDAASIFERHMPEHWILGDIRWRYGQCMAEVGGDFAKAEPLVLDGVATLTDRWGIDDPRTVAARAAAARLYDAWDRPEDAARFRTPE